MLFVTIFVSFLLIGSSNAHSDAEIMASLRMVNWCVNNYITELAEIYGGFVELQLNPVYKTYLKQDGIIQLAVVQMGHNQQIPGVPVVVTKSAENVKTDWKNATLGAINECIRGTDAKRQADPVGVPEKVIKATSRLMYVINGKPENEILNEHKRRGCPIYDRLSEIVNQYGTPAQRQEFESNYGGPAPQ